MVPKVLEQTLSPLWEELLVFDQLIVDGRQDHLREDPPLVVINFFDHNKFVSLSPPPPHFQLPLPHCLDVSSSECLLSILPLPL